MAEESNGLKKEGHLDGEAVPSKTMPAKHDSADEYAHFAVPVPHKDLHRRPRRQRLRYAGAVGVILLSLGAGLLGGWIESDHNSSHPTTTAQKEVVSSESQLINSIAKTVSPSVVSVNVTGQTTTQSFFGPQTQSQQSAGTGIIISSNGLIVTNRHVVPQGTTSVSVTLSDGTELDNVQVLGRTSTSDSLDIAFLKITDTKGKKLVPATLGDSSKVQVGDRVVAIGNALGQFQNTVTSGIISGFGRSVQASEDGDQTGSTSENLQDLFQTDAAINEGNSGGPLVNASGQVIGINTAIAGGAQNIGFSIPINDVSGLIKTVLQTGKFQQPFLGVRYISLTNDVAKQLNLKTTTGAYVIPADRNDGQDPVVSGSPAAKAGIKGGDIIEAVDGTNIDENHSLTSLLDQHSVGDQVSLKVLRNGNQLSVSVTLAAADTNSQ